MVVKKTGAKVERAAAQAATRPERSTVYEPPAGKKLVQLCNGIATYVTPSGAIYYADKVYSVSEEKQAELFSYTETIQGMPVFRTAIIKKRRVTEESYIAEAGKVDEPGEIDTGAMQLKNAEGSKVGMVDI
jgi:hypothetical protein